MLLSINLARHHKNSINYDSIFKFTITETMASHIHKMLNDLDIWRCGSAHQNPNLKPNIIELNIKFNLDMHLM